ncbi:NADH-quinone oxidoreductase subunit H [bacterium (Candidatus Blackallbacteria) CG17_big_fil_post_rev_8_21_14_2_50_48_46]|uniref:NADH-quinone oxidoreductase subunit H n=1 Tax=bacterium (Candidatus Blackallbacteria) CG17_big_fil_post_rev_8_21_14_2_50_48_46 TaxID=2014261 RepID=A0A2M7G2F5_9BACT|nr:MAG: NADH-quinone oxidoreductase subunit H [bacterium (Candidatus Blackallbacteria) CG18_big_fil_WC_8_21_14_2_50_49_26]PIW15968.1 MAG: NADH-quinone oxidoreductase subunit H [bacterium (Candidatus Blackallbacteria) CG17_big_fil_post_rev_8_21_14_2_50_48_46]PIW50380.1 MAG: NADH-quinone oxidoreductase subunit H [bacterium (Candidatus Blackallbacteria) CG13_big_fil_rev_8_21_14_2_50_49_14]
MIDPIMALVIFIKALFVLLFGLSMVPLLVWLERKVSALMQDRIGPNRAAIGFIRLGGLIHLIADSLKMLSKEQIIPKGVHFFHYMLAPVVIATVALVILPIVPFADVLKIGGREIPMQVLNIDAGLLWYFAMTSLMVYGVVLAGWSSNNKFSLLGGMRSSAQLISYELPLGLSVIGIVMLTGTVHLNEIVRQQGDLLFGFIPKWGILLQPLAAIVFVVCAFAETNRAPFDLAEGESELVGGFHTEYSGMLFGTFFMAEYVAMVVASSMIVTLFLGGWQIPFMNTAFLIEKAALLTQVSLAGGAVVLLGLAVYLFRYYQKHSHRFGDLRDKEALIFSGLLGLAALGSLGLLALILALGFPQEWAGPLFAALAQMGMFIGKLMFVLIMFIWVRWTLPRFRYDQLMFLGWKSLLPLALANIFLTGLGVALTGGLSGG